MAALSSRNCAAKRLSAPSRAGAAARQPAEPASRRPCDFGPGQSGHGQPRAVPRAESTPAHADRPPRLLYAERHSSAAGAAEETLTPRKTRMRPLLLQRLV